MRTTLQNVPAGGLFMLPNSPNVFEHRGNGWNQVYNQTKTGGPWHLDQQTAVDVEESDPPHPSQTLSAFI